jgi:hypothetical protein
MPARKGMGTAGFAKEKTASGMKLATLFFSAYFV